jgi:hypothetical protein
MTGRGIIAKLIGHVGVEYSMRSAHNGDRANAIPNSDSQNVFIIDQIKIADLGYKGLLVLNPSFIRLNVQSGNSHA